MSRDKSILSRKRKHATKNAVLKTLFATYMARARITRILQTPNPKFDVGSIRSELRSGEMAIVGEVGNETIVGTDGIIIYLAGDNARFQNAAAIVSHLADAVTSISNAFREVGNYKNNPYGISK
jgi:hypothetical protein